MTVEGQLLWEPSSARREAAVVTAYEKHLEATRGLTFADPQRLWHWSVSEVGDFWDSVWEFTQIVGERGSGAALAVDRQAHEAASVRCCQRAVQDADDPVHVLDEVGFGVGGLDRQHDGVEVERNLRGRRGAHRSSPCSRPGR